MFRSFGRRWRSVAALCVLGLVLVACGEDTSGGGSDGGGGGGNGKESELSGTIVVDGSSTVAPLTSTAAELFQKEHPRVKITVGTSGTGGGFKKFCAGETDMSNASRPIKEDDEFEGQACKRNGIAYEELTIANDGIAIVVNPGNDWAECLTVEQLKSIWEPAAQGRVNNWKQVDPSFPDQKLTLFGAGTASGTFDFFTAAINGEEKASRADYSATEDDNTTVQGVAGDKGALGYLGLSYYEENQGKLKVVKVDDGEGCVEPSRKTVQDGSYKPLGRPLFVYPTAKLLQRPEGLAFVEFFVERSDEIAERALFVPLTEEQKQEAAEAVRRLEERYRK